MCVLERRYQSQLLTRVCPQIWALSLINVPAGNTACTTSSVVTRVCPRAVGRNHNSNKKHSMHHVLCRNTCMSPEWRYQSQILTRVCPQMGAITEKCPARNTARTTSSVVTHVCPQFDDITYVPACNTARTMSSVVTPVCPQLDEIT